MRQGDFKTLSNRLRPPPLQPHVFLSFLFPLSTMPPQHDLGPYSLLSYSASGRGGTNCTSHVAFIQLAYFSPSPSLIFLRNLLEMAHCPLASPPPFFLLQASSPYVYPGIFLGNTAFSPAVLFRVYPFPTLALPHSTSDLYSPLPFCAPRHLAGKIACKNLSSGSRTVFWLFPRNHIRWPPTKPSLHRATVFPLCRPPLELRPGFRPNSVLMSQIIFALVSGPRFLSPLIPLIISF